LYIKEILIPTGIDNCTNSFSKLSINLLNQINSINSNNIQNKKMTIINPTVSNQDVIKREEIKLISNNNIFFDIYAVSPIGNLVRNRIVNSNYNQLNDFSIGLYYIVNDFVLFLSSDLEDISYNNMTPLALKNMITPNILKLPHHGSKYSLKFYEKFKRNIISGNDMIDIVVTTNYKNNNLPEEEVLLKYCDITKELYRIDKIKTSNNLANITF
jgi:hypothetical protein